MPSYVPNLSDYEKSRRQKILIILHQEASTPGRIGSYLVNKGFSLDIRHPRFGDPLPQTMRDYCGAVIFGGPMSANDNEDYVHAEIDWISVCLNENAPFLGVCLGAQMLAKNLGAHVGFHPDGQVEVGYYPLQATCEGQALMDWPTHVYQWHREDAELPKGATLLATNDLHPCQAFHYGTAFGLQFHPEVNLAMMNRWSVKGAQRMTLPGAQQRGEHFLGRRLYDAAVCQWLDAFLDIWLEVKSQPVNIPLSAAG